MSDSKKQLEFEYAVVNELSLKYKARTDLEPVVITGPDFAIPFLRKIWNDQIARKESFYIVLMNSQKVVTGYALISQGGSTATIVDPAEIMRIALLADAHSVLLAHNHPSGNLDPSKADKNLTNRIVESGKLLGITVVDHLIISEGSYTSMRERDLIN